MRSFGHFSFKYVYEFVWLKSNLVGTRIELSSWFKFVSLETIIQNIIALEHLYIM